MALPIIAAGIAARAVAKKLATRVAGGITGAGAKNVAPINRNMGTGSVKVKPRQSYVPKVNQSLAKLQRDQANKMAVDRKSGGEARLQKYLAEPDSARGAISTAKKIKINSNPTRNR
jgi:hypothetical protein